MMVTGDKLWHRDRRRLLSTSRRSCIFLLFIASCGLQQAAAEVLRPLVQFASHAEGSTGQSGCAGCRGVEDALGQPQLAEYQSCSNNYGLAWEPDSYLDR